MIEFIDLKSQQLRIKDKIDAGIQRVLSHGQYILGPEVSELEEKLAAFVGAKYCISCANGTDALQIAQMAFGIGPGDEVITSAYSYTASASPVVHVGATLVIVDTQKEDLAKVVMDAGKLVSDEIVLGMLEERIAQPDARGGFILDGYPRNLAQCAALEGLLARIGKPLDVAIELDVPDSAILERCEIRFKAEHRPDDDPAIVRKRLQVYREQTAPVARHFADMGKLVTVNGVGSVDAVFARILEVLPRAVA